jgi:hypothetical protein
MRKLLLSFTILASLLHYAGSALAQTITTVAGGGNTYLANNTFAMYAALYAPTGIAFDVSGTHYYFVDCNPSGGYGCVVYKVTVSTGVINLIAGTGSAGYTGDGGLATSATFSQQVNGITVAPSGNIYICDSLYSVIRKITVTSGIITTYAGYNPTKSLYSGGYNGDGKAATSTWWYYPSGVASDGTNLFIADWGNHRVRKVNTYGVVSTIAGNGTEGYTGDGGAATSATLDHPSGVVFDSLGNIYFTSTGINGHNSSVRLITVSTGTITTFAGGINNGIWGDGGPAASAGLNNPWNLALDSLQNLYIADTLNNEIREVSNGVINTVAGNGGSGFNGDGGPAKNAELNRNNGVAIDASGAIYIADTYNGRIRKVQ